MADVILCCHCGTTIERANERAKGWRHSATGFLTCDPSAAHPTFAEPEPTQEPVRRATNAQMRGAVRAAILDAIVHSQPRLRWRWEPGHAGQALQVEGFIDLVELEAFAAAQILDVAATVSGVTREGESFDDL